MRRYTGIFFYILGGVLAGAGSAYALIQHAGVESLGTDTPWESRAGGLESDASIYVSSYYLLAGRLPLASGQMVEAIAETDGDNETLSTSCAYDITSIGALPRWWSLTAADIGTASTSMQQTLDSDGIIAEADGVVKITASAVPQPGNWLKLPESRHFSLLFASVPRPGRTSETSPAFAIKRRDC